MGTVDRYLDPGFYVKDGVKTPVPVEFHLAGQHDQKSHGSWSGVKSEKGLRVGDFRDTFGGVADLHNLMDKNPAIQAGGSIALDSIASVISIEKDWPKVIAMPDAGDWLGEDEGSLGAYMPPGPDDEGGHIDRGRVVFRGTGDVGSIASTLVHELGHHLSIAKSVESFRSEINRPGSALGKLMSAINESPTIKDLHGIEDKISARVDAEPSLRDQLGFVQYLDMDEEKFARAFSQYITMKTKEPSMVNSLVRTLKDDNDSIMQWTPNEWRPIESAMDEYLRDRGILK